HVVCQHLTQVQRPSIYRQMGDLTSAKVPYATHEPIKIGVSSCLLGAQVRFDGGHKRNDFLVETLGNLVEFVAICPEMEIGLGAPRESMHLVRGHASHSIRLVTTKTDMDLTDRMRSYAERRVAALAKEKLCGYVLKKDSPSCGMEQVRVYGSSGIPARDGSG